MYKQNQQHISLAMLSGAWVKGILIASKIQTKIKEVYIEDLIAKQKTNLETLLAVYKKLNSNELRPLQMILQRMYDEVYSKAILTKGEILPIMVEKNGRLVIEKRARIEGKISSSLMPKLYELCQEAKNSLK